MIRIGKPPGSGKWLRYPSHPERVGIIHEPVSQRRASAARVKAAACPERGRISDRVERGLQPGDSLSPKETGLTGPDNPLPSNFRTAGPPVTNLNHFTEMSSRGAERRGICGCSSAPVPLQTSGQPVILPFRGRASVDRPGRVKRPICRFYGNNREIAPIASHQKPTYLQRTEHPIRPPQPTPSN